MASLFRGIVNLFAALWRFLMSGGRSRSKPQQPSETPVPAIPAENSPRLLPGLLIRRRVARKALLGRTLIRTGRYETREEMAQLEEVTPKGGNFILSNGGRCHRKSRDIIDDVAIWRR